MACTWGSKVNGILTVFAIGFAVLIDLWDILDVHKEGHTMVKFYALYGYFLSYPFIVRITSGSTSLRGPLDLL
jgi:dolichyl-phosphate-mannose-protein mannosyltransferase